MKIAICIGHNNRAQGMFSKRLNATEYEFNTRVANIIKDEIGKDATVFNRRQNSGYNAEITELANRVNSQKFDLAIELHFNAFNEKANGCEALYFHKSIKGKEYAESFCKVISNEYGSINRGAKPLSLVSQNGYGFVQKMKAPSLILEPFFGDHPEAEKFINVQRYACAVVEWINNLNNNN